MIGIRLKRYPAKTLYAASLASKLPEVSSLTLAWPSPAPRYRPLAAEAMEIDTQLNRAVAGMIHSLRYMAAPCPAPLLRQCRENPPVQQLDLGPISAR